MDFFRFGNKGSITFPKGFTMLGIIASNPKYKTIPAMKTLQKMILAVPLSNLPNAKSLTAPHNKNHKAPIKM